MFGGRRERPPPLSIARRQRDSRGLSFAGRWNGGPFAGACPIECAVCTVPITMGVLSGRFAPSLPGLITLALLLICAPAGCGRSSSTNVVGPSPSKCAVSLSNNMPEVPAAGGGGVITVSCAARMRVVGARGRGLDHAERNRRAGNRHGGLQRCGQPQRHAYDADRWSSRSRASRLFRPRRHAASW